MMHDVTDICVGVFSQSMIGHCLGAAGGLEAIASHNHRLGASDHKPIRKFATRYKFSKFTSLKLLVPEKLNQASNEFLSCCYTNVMFVRNESVVIFIYLLALLYRLQNPEPAVYEFDTVSGVKTAARGTRR